MSSVDERFRAQFAELERQRQEQRARMEEPTLRTGGGRGTSGSGMEERVTRLEVQMEAVRSDLGEIKADLRSTLEVVRGLPTKADLNTFRWQWVATAVAAIALIVGGIIGGLSWIKPDVPTAAPATAPIVIQVPMAQPAGAPVGHRTP